MKILSIDVGIKNFAYCLVNFENNEIYIDEWDVINICKNNKCICNEKLKKGTTCGKNAKYYKNDSYYCNIHSKNSNFLKPTEEIRILDTKIKKNKRISEKKLIEFCKQNDLEYKKSKDELKKIILNHINNKYLDIVEKINANKLNMVECGILLKKKLDNTFNDKHIDMISQHFIEKKLENIEYINASNKLKDFLNGKKTTYNERKKLSISITKNILETELKLNTWVNYFNKSSKKDDLADAYLQCLWYINHILRTKSYIKN